MSVKILRIILALVLVFWLSMIFALSAEDATESNSTSAGFTYRVFCLVYPEFDEMSPDEQQQIISDFSFIIRKTAHFSIYMILGALSFINLSLYDRVTRRIRLAGSWIFCVLYAVSDEIHQFFVPGRACQFRDVCIDGLGSFVGILICVLFIRFRLLTKIRRLFKGRKKA